MSEETLIAKAGGGSSFPPHPEDQFAATCIDIIDLGMVETTWQGQTRKKHRICLRFFCDEWFVDDEGKNRPLWVDKYLTFSLHENSAMRPFLESWRGKKFTEEELHEGFNVAKLLYAPAFLQITHNVTPDKTYANIATIMKLPKGQVAPGVPEGYVRVKDRPKDVDTSNGRTAAPHPADDDDLPF